MSLVAPTSLSPSKVSAFKDCALAFRFAVIDRLPETPSPAAVKGTLVHRALELLYCTPALERSLDQALAHLSTAAAELAEDPEYTMLGLDAVEEQAFLAEATELVKRYFVLEDPRTIHPIGLELKLEARVGGVLLRGIIDRLELDSDGGLVVTDYKTGRAPTERYEQGRLGGVHFYAYLCQSMFGQRPVRVQLLHLQEPLAIVATPSEQSVAGLERRVSAIWAAVERACTRDDFRPRPGPLCDWCSFKAYCPAVGGDMSLIPVGAGAG